MGCECPETRLGAAEGNTLLNSPSKILSSSPCPCPGKPGKGWPWKVPHCLLLELILIYCCSFTLTTSNKHKQEAVWIKNSMKGGGEADLSGKCEGEEG